MKNHGRALCGLVVGLLFAAPAHALTIHVDWSADAVPNFHPLGTIHVQGSFGDFEVAAFPALSPLTVPFSARAPGFGPGFTDDVYTFESQTNLAFEFTAADRGLRGVGAIGVSTAAKSVCLPSPPYCQSGESWSLRLEAPAEGGPATLLLTDTDFHSGYSYFWSGPVQYAFTVVPEPTTLGSLAAGLVALGSCRRLFLK